MHHHLRRASPTLLVLGGLGVALVGALTHDVEYAVPAALLLVLTGAVAASRLRRRPLPVAGVTGTRVLPLIPTQRTSRYRTLPPPGDPGAGPDVRPWVLPTPRTSGRDGVNRPGRPAPGRPRHCVLPRGQVPHQRRAPGAS